MTRSFILTTVAVSTLAACGGGGLGGPITTPAQQEYTARLNDAGALSTSIFNEAPNGLRQSDVPTRGEAAFQGFAVIDIATPRANSRVLGDSLLIANFGDRTIRGTLGEFVGSVNGDAVRQYDGVIQMSGGFQNSGPNDRANIGTIMNGNLRGGANVISITGGMSGFFRTDGTDADPQTEAVQLFSTSGTDFLVVTPSGNRTFDNLTGVNEIRVMADRIE